VTHPERWRRIETILGRALEMPKEERASFLDQECGEDAGLRGEVEALLAADSRAAGFLLTPGTQAMATATQGAPGAGSGPQLAEGQRIGRRYRVIRLIGKGGMGIVYQVHDLELDREIAMKLILGPLSEDPAILERFRREVHLASKITHRNVLRVYDLGESDGVKFLTMELVPGRDLGKLLREEKLLALPRALHFFRQIAEGLAAAHEQQVLHRDLKPQNILVDETDRVYITDFGLAKTLGLSDLTHTGASLGTPHYMSPEQVRSEKVDERTDLYSLGVILYEMLTGCMPFDGVSPLEVALQRLHREPTPAIARNPAVPPYLDAMVRKCLALDPSRRYGSAREILADLDAQTVRPAPRRIPAGAKRLLGALAVLLGLAALAWGGWHAYRGSRPAARATSEAAAAAAVPSLGILPFENRTGRPELDWYGEGLAHLVSDNLVQSKHVRVVSASVMEGVRSQAKEPADRLRLASRRGIGYFLTGEILPGPKGPILAARLTETGKGQQVTAHRVEGLTLESLASASEGIAVEARKGLGIPPTEHVDVFSADFPSGNPAAYEHYLKGLRFWSQYRYDQAETAYREALRQAPDYAMARYRLAQLLAESGKVDEGLGEIRKALAQALNLTDRERLYLRASEAYLSNRNDEAVKIYTDLVAAHPYDTEARYLLCVVLTDEGKNREALEQLQILVKLEPENPITWSFMGSTYLSMGDFSQGIVAMKRFLEMEPRNANGHHLLGDAYRSQAEFDLAAQEYSEALKIDPAFYYSATSLAELDVMRSRWNEAETRLSSIVSEAKAPARSRIDAVFDLAFLYRARGRFREANEVLERAEEPIAREQVREAMALAVRGLSLMEAGDSGGARRLIDAAIRRAPAAGAPTRYLFARGLRELKGAKLEEVRRTAEQILEGSRADDGSDRTKEKAAEYLKGMVSLAEGSALAAVDNFSRAVALSGYEYTIYRLGLAHAYYDAGRLTEAMAAARQAAELSNPNEPRLDLELDRARARSLLARIQLKMGLRTEARSTARPLLTLWDDPDPGFKDAAEARRLAAGGGS
jgi:tetratricopeptide (TPR) repeat protein/TolB-like protein/predicted Ser/Thr protein kinase